MMLGCLEIFACTNAKNNKEEKGNQAPETGFIQLEKPDLNRGVSVMQAFLKRKSTKECSEKELSLRDLSDLLWAANGINRPESGKRTAPSAMNRQDVKIYACMKKGSYKYDPENNKLELISEGDARPAEAPVVLVLVSDTGDTWAILDAGIVSQNISIFCSGIGLADYPKGSMDRSTLAKALKLGDKQTLMLCHPVGYFK